MEVGEDSVAARDTEEGGEEDSKAATAVGGEDSLVITKRDARFRGDGETRGQGARNGPARRGRSSPYQQGRAAPLLDTSLEGGDDDGNDGGTVRRRRRRRL